MAFYSLRFKAGDRILTSAAEYASNYIAYLQAGAGIVYDSDPDREFDETVNKAKALFKAVEFAEKGLEP